jgi:hypothetical protein
MFATTESEEFDNGYRHCESHLFGFPDFWNTTDMLVSPGLNPVPWNCIYYSFYKDCAITSVTEALQCMDGSEYLFYRFFHQKPQRKYRFLAAGPAFEKPDEFINIRTCYASDIEERENWESTALVISDEPMSTCDIMNVGLYEEDTDYESPDFVDVTVCHLRITASGYTKKEAIENWHRYAAPVRQLVDSMTDACFNFRRAK